MTGVTREPGVEDPLEWPGRIVGERRLEATGDERGVSLQAREAALEDAPVRGREDVGGEVAGIGAEVLAVVGERLRLDRPRDDDPRVHPVEPELGVLEQALEDDQT